MDERKVWRASSTEGLPVAPSMGPALESIAGLQRSTTLSGRVVFLTFVSVLIGLAGAGAAQALLRLIGFITNLAFYGRLGTDFVSPAGNRLGLLAIAIPAVGGVVVGLMARYGSEAIRGHGIPEVMERVLRHQSRISPRETFLKPVSAALAIGTGGPFGAEGPIIATGGALGSLVGQVLETTADERKVLLSAGAAAGMAGTFGSPVAAVLLAVELLLFEFRARSFIPVAFASAAAAAVRIAWVGVAPIFAMSAFTPAGPGALALYTLVGAAAGVAAVFVTRVVYAVEEAFGRLPIHWMWWPAMGGLVVGLIGYFLPATLGVGYDNITRELGGSLGLRALVLLCLFKFVAWSIALGSGTSGGTLAPLFTIGGALGAALGLVGADFFPFLDVRVAALVGMAAIFAGASRAFLASVVFALEVTLQPAGLLPVLCGCAAAYLVSSLLMQHTIMTEKIARRGIHVPTDYAADFLAQIPVRDAASYQAVSLDPDSTLGEVRRWIAQGRPEAAHHGFPVVDSEGRLLGMVNQRDLLDPSEPESRRIGEIMSEAPAVILEDNTLSEASHLMVREEVGRLPVVSRQDQRKLVAIITRRDIMAASHRRLGDASEGKRTIGSRLAASQRSGGVTD